MSKKKIKIGGFKTQLWHACGNDELRPVMNYAHVKDGFIYATDAHILVKQSLRGVHDLDETQVENLEGKFFHKDLLKLLDKQEVVMFEKDGISICSSGIEKSLIPYSECDIKFPNCDAVIPDSSHSESINFIGITPKILSRLIKSMYKSEFGYRFTFYGKMRAILLNSGEFDRSDEIGLIMPTNTENF